ncbi:hypothetical protein F5Y03DRAFT_372353 [Xylaria venustula]|nr:hypothetical protein F5Y03DRAFT_372353 [Xylaria venustula]
MLRAMLSPSSAAVARAALFQPTGSAEIGLRELFRRRLGETMIYAIDVIISLLSFLVAYRSNWGCSTLETTPT